MLYNPTFKKIEYYLYNYDRIDIKLEILKASILDYEYNQSYTRWIKNKSSSLEDQVIRNVNLERKILQMKKWKHLITKILQEYRLKDKIKYKFINLKYFKKYSIEKIEEVLDIGLKEQKDMQRRILKYIFCVAKEKDILK